MRKPAKVIPEFEDHIRFLKAIDVKDNQCWQWNRSLIKSGYGVFRLKNNNKWSMYLAHRVSWSIFKGDLDLNLVIDHMCKNRGCVNPDHLRQVTNEHNVMINSDGVAPRNKLKTHCYRGHNYSVVGFYPYKGKRKCSECNRENSRSRRLKERLARCK